MKIKTAGKSTESVRQWRQRQRDKGMVPKEIWVYPNAWDYLKQVIAEASRMEEENDARHGHINDIPLDNSFFERNKDFIE